MFKNKNNFLSGRGVMGLIFWVKCDIMRTEGVMSGYQPPAVGRKALAD